MSLIGISITLVVLWDAACRAYGSRCALATAGPGCFRARRHSWRLVLATKISGTALVELAALPL